ncbi:MAG: hypothetical protein FWC64_07955 [Treponema sp.]|nr:hypothetical protein [Treponema sp.]
MNCKDCDTRFKWSWAKFFKGKCSNKFIAFLVATAIFAVTMFAAGVLKDAVAQRTLIIIWGVITVIFMLSGSIDKFVSGGTLSVNANLSAGVKKNISTDTARGQGSQGGRG